MNRVIVAGAGLAGSEAAWQIAQRGVPVQLWEMRPSKMTPAHQTGEFAELVCSNSFRGNALENAVGLLKEELRRLDSLIMKVADETKVPAGGALAVNREQFSQSVTKLLSNHQLVEVVRGELTEIPAEVCVIATGPLTSPLLAEKIREFTGHEYFYFYDAIAPIVLGETINFQKVFQGSRYDKGEGVYLNCPFTQEEYLSFWNELVGAEVAENHLPDEEAIFFEGCMPVEVLAKRGVDTLRYGPMKPVGLIDPATGVRPYALVQLRLEDKEGKMYNLVGFQTHLKWGEQRRLFQMIPGLERAEFVRYGVMHRNSYLNAPVVLKETLQTKLRPSLFFAGQITGVEGYVESVSSGLVAGINCAKLIRGEPLLEFPPETAIGALNTYICGANPKFFQPMNVNFGLFPSLSERKKGKKQRHMALSERSFNVLNNI